MTETITVAFAHWRLDFHTSDPSLSEIVRWRYAGFIEAAGSQSRSAETEHRLEFQLSWDKSLTAEHPTRFEVVPARDHPSAGRVRIVSGALAGELDLSTGRGRIGLVPPDAPGSNARMPHMALENYLRIAIAMLAPATGAALVHSAAVTRLDGRSAVLLHGPSGAGKSTSAALSAAADPRHEVLSDDLIVVDSCGAPAGQPRVHATPFWGDDRPGERPRRPLAIAAICELEQAPEHAMIPVSAAEGMGGVTAAIPFQGFMPPEAVSKLLEVAEHVTAGIPCYRLRFRKDSGFWLAIEDSLASSRPECSTSTGESAV